MTRAVLFDLDGTLVQYRRSPGEVLDRSYDRLGVDPVFPVEAYYDRYDEFAERASSMRELRRECFAALAAERGRSPSLGREIAAAFDHERDQSNVEPLSGVRPMLDSLAERYALGVVTNGARDAQLTKLDATGLGQYFDTVVVAGDDCEPKPAVAPFEMALADLETKPERAVHVGDSPGTDIAGGAAAGLDTVLVAPEPEESTATYVVSSPAALRSPPWE
ncbi:putative hydrolase of the HAD superfamily [Halovenus aranensis]|jgi:putative hydrolase of the HAD superfamily|uniref:Putative hydrolase of the HAD superfamily n=1 Tax=Halovenus aranensis TaxID=890420 RepID=A0A1G8YKQ3_9EURY|nr:HAD family hydrolase [Halovenus aranensis]SDK03341.1 putative hydrolase of the HAD superfamily [Halovenus aranensis]